MEVAAKVNQLLDISNAQANDILVYWVVGSKVQPFKQIIQFQVNESCTTTHVVQQEA